MNIIDKIDKYLNEMDSMTYGKIPPFKMFKKNFDKEVDGDTYNYNLKGSDLKIAKRVKIPASGDFTAKELYSIIIDLSQSWDDGFDDAGDLASSILSTLNIEWI